MHKDQFENKSTHVLNSGSLSLVISEKNDVKVL